MGGRLTAAAVGLNLVAAALHGLSHGDAAVTLATWQTAYVTVADIVGPVAGAALALRGRPRVGGAVVAASLSAAFAFSVLHHFALTNPDHVSAAGTAGFAATALLLAGTEALGALVGAATALRN